MKFNYFLFLFPLLLFFSCSENNDELQAEDVSVNRYPQTWKLFKMTGMLEGSQSTGKDMEWQEEYVLNRNNTFVKTKIKNKDKTSITGTYSISQENGKVVYLLKYEAFSPLIGSCKDLQESLYFGPNNKFLLSNWWACDGPGLFYKRIK